MSNRTKNTAIKGIRFAGLLTFIFIALKKIGKIHWPWIWVISPMWITAIVVMLLVMIVSIVIAVRSE